MPNYDIIQNINNLIAESDKCKYSDLKKTLEICEQALDLAKSINYERGKAQSLLIMGGAYTNAGDFENSVSCLFDALEICENFNLYELEGLIYNSIGNVFIIIGDYEKSMKFYIRSMKIAKTNNDELLMCLVTNNIGEINYKLKIYEDALKYYSESAVIDAKHDYIYTKGISLINIGQTHYFLGNYDMSIDYISRGRIYTEQNNYLLVEADISQTLALCYWKKGNCKLAKDYFIKALDVTLALSTKINEIEVLMDYHLFLKSCCENENALNCLKRALSIANSINASVKLLAIYSHLAKLYEELNNNSKAFKYYKLYQEADNQLEKTRYTQRIESIKMQSSIEQITEEKDIIFKDARELKQSMENISLMNNIGQTITSTLDIKEIENIIYQNFKKLINISSFYIGTFDEQNETINYEFIMEQDTLLKAETISANNPNSFASYCIYNKQLIVINDLMQDYSKYVVNINNSPLIGGLDINSSLIFCPLIINDTVIGVLSVQIFEKNSFTNFHVEMVKVLSSYAAIALNNAQKSRNLQLEIEKRMQIQNELERLNKKLRILSELDELTRIANRRKFLGLMNVQWEKSKKAQKHISLIMLDIDKFKEYNDNYGHLAGDNVLMTVATAITTSLPNKDCFVARYGGDEFIVSLADTSYYEAIKFGKNLKNKIRSLKIPHDFSSISQYLGISLGVSSVIPSNNTSINELLKNSDDALYDAKNKRVNYFK